MEASSTARVLVVAHKTAATPALMNAVRERAARGPARFHLLVPNPAHPNLRHPSEVTHPNVTEGEQVLALALPLIEEACGGRPTDGSVSPRHNPMDAIEETLHEQDFDEIILSTLPARVSRWLKLDLGYAVSIGIFGGLIAAVTIGHYVFGMNAVLSFWLAYILTRPLGASIGDEMSQNSHKYGGLGLGTTGTSYIFLGCILALVAYLSFTRKDATETRRATPLPESA